VFPIRDAGARAAPVRPWYRGRRVVVALVLVVLVVGLRVALPSILRSQIEKQANAALAGTLTIGDVDLWLLSGGVALKDLALRAENTPPDVPPVLTLKRLYIQVGYLPFFRHTVRVRDFALDGPVVHLERLAAGEVPLPGVRAAPPAAPAGTTPTTATTPSRTIPETEPAAKASRGAPWNIVVDQAAVHDGRLSLRDHVSDPPTNAELALDSLGFENFTLLQSEDGTPGHGSIEAEFGDGRVRIGTTVTTRPEGYAFEATVDVTNLPLDRLQQHAPQLGWRTFTGRLDAHVTLRAEPNELPASSGTVALRDLHIEVPGESEPALAWRKLAVDVEEIGLARRRAILKSVLLDGGAMVVTPKGVAPLPLLRGRAASATQVAATASGAEPAAPAPTPGAEPALASEPPRPWVWKVGTVDIVDTRATIVLEPPPLVVEIAKGTITGLESAPGSRAQVDLNIQEEQGTLALAGTVGLDPLAAQLTAKIAGLPLGRLLAAATGTAPVKLPTGTLTGDVTIRADRGPLVVAGKLGIADLGVRLPEGEDFGVNWKQLDLDIKEVRVPGVLPGTAPATPQPVRVDLDSLKLLAPVVTLTRTAGGLVLPGSGPPAAEPAPAKAPPKRAPAAKPTPQSPAPAATAGPGVTVTLRQLDLQAGQVNIVDQTVKPFYRGKLSAMSLKARGFRFPENVFDDFAFTATLPGGAPLKVDAKQVKGTITLAVDGKALPLSQFNPYVTQAAGYSISDGRLSVNSKVRWAPDSYDSKTNVELDKLSVAGAEGDSLFFQKVGIPLQLALSLLRDLNGKIALAVPVSGDKSGMRVGLGEVVAQAIVKAIVGAVTSPLKMLGVVADLAAGGGGALTPEPIPCGPGLPTVDAAAGERVQQLGGALGGAPALRIMLHGMAGGPDVRALQEAAVLADLQAKQGVLSGIKNLANRGERNAIRDFLVAKASGGKADLSPDYQKTLDEWAGAKTISDDQLRTLAAARAEGVKNALTTGQGVDAARVSVGDPEVDREKGKPAVRIGFGS
jgi:uncharacterized protein DUF748